MLLVGTLAVFVSVDVAGGTCNIGTLFTSVLVCARVLITRKATSDVPRFFKIPLIPFVPTVDIITYLVMVLLLPVDTWTCLVLRMLTGLDVYVCHGIEHSKLEHMQKYHLG